MLVENINAKMEKLILQVLFGCSGVYKQKDGQFIGGNEAVTDFINDIQGRQSVNKDKSLQIQTSVETQLTGGKI